MEARNAIEQEAQQLSDDELATVSGEGCPFGHHVIEHRQHAT